MPGESRRTNEHTLLLLLAVDGRTGSNAPMTQVQGQRKVFSLSSRPMEIVNWILKGFGCSKTDTSNVKFFKMNGCNFGTLSNYSSSKSVQYTESHGRSHSTRGWWCSLLNRFYAKFYTFLLFSTRMTLGGLRNGEMV